MSTAMKKIVISAFGAGLTLFATAGCEDRPNGLSGKPDKFVEDPSKQIPEIPGAFAGGEKNTFDHSSSLGEDAPKDAQAVLAQRKEEGPPEIRTRMHSCQKIQVATLRSMLESFGVNMDATGNPPTAGQLLKSGTQALGAANYDARVGESIVWTAAGAAKYFDILVQAAPEIIANLPNVQQCQVNGAGPQVFDADNKCVEDALTCLMGRPATAQHVAICNSIVQSASNIETGKNIAIATLLSAAHSCE